MMVPPQRQTHLKFSQMITKSIGQRNPGPILKSSQTSHEAKKYTQYTQLNNTHIVK